MNVKLSREDKIKVNSSESVYGIMQRVLMRENKIGRKKEHFWVIGLTSNGIIEYIELVALGSLNAVGVKPMEVYSWALQKRCANIILVHNHPSGECKPTLGDRDMTGHLLQVGNFINIMVLDHLIISEESYYSFADTGLMDKLAASKKYIPGFMQMEQLKKEAEEIGKAQGKKEQSKTIAKSLKKKGISIKIIAATTGLTEEEVIALK